MKSEKQYSNIRGVYGNTAKQYIKYLLAELKNSNIKL